MADVAAVSDRGRVRDDNQDRSLVRRSGRTTLLAVADGVGGEAGGDVASAAAVDALAGGFDGSAPDAATALSSAIRAANDAVVKASAERGHPMAASTIVAAAVRGRRVAVANLGDSRAYLVRAKAARQITADHSGPTSSSITRFVGDPRGVAPDVFVESLRARDRLVLCSDGLTRHVSPEEIASLAVGSPPRAAQALVDLANERGGEDNVTVVIYASPLLTLGRGALALGAIVAVALLAAVIGLSR